MDKTIDKLNGGVINVLKPPGMTSSDVVSELRRVLGMKKVGHTGTLDPGAAGVLPICAGRATRLFDYLVDKEKEYIAEVVFGAATDTQDSYGTVIATDDKVIDEKAFVSVLSGFMGEQMQTAPMYSALSHNGQKLYKLARAGETVERKARRIVISSIELVRQLDENRFLIKLVCSRGTYVRTICSDIGERLGTCAHLGFLLRSSSGAFNIDTSYSIAELNAMRDAGTLQAAIMPVDEAISHIQRLQVPENAFQKHLLINGCEVEYESLLGQSADALRLYYKDDFLGIGSLSEGKLKITVNFYDENNS